MKKTIRLTESEIVSLVKKVLNEELLTENAKSLDKWKLYTTYKLYNNLGSKKTFETIFKDFKTDTAYEGWENGCATKVSLALNAAGYKVKPGYKVTKGAQKGNNIQPSAAGLKTQLTNNWGEPDVKWSGSKTEQEVQKLIGKGRTGVLICSPCGFGEGASGHATVWSRSGGKNMLGGTVDGTTYHMSPSANVSFWQVGNMG